MGQAVGLSVSKKEGKIAALGGPLAIGEPNPRIGRAGRNRLGGCTARPSSGGARGAGRGRKGELLALSVGVGSACWPSWWKKRSSGRGGDMIPTVRRSVTATRQAK